MNIEIYCREEVEIGVVIRGAYSLISIRDPDKPSVQYKRQSGLRGVLELAFHDAEPTGGVTLPAEIRLFDETHALAICEFVAKQRASVDVFVVHCEQGMSRSPAVAAGVATMLGAPTVEIFQDFQPNWFVYELLLDTWKHLDTKESQE